MRLQWGRDQLIAETCKPPFDPNEARKASMGPRSIDRGNLGIGSTGTLGPFGLQWGRDQLIAETRQRLAAPDHA